MYTQWFAKSVELTGKLEFKNEKQSMALKVMEHIGGRDKSLKSKGVRIAEKLSMLPPIR
jgi:hypothetical protein